MKIIGLCGSSGSGKGYISMLFNKYGVLSIDTDRVYRETTTKKGSECLLELTKEFGNSILKEDGTLYRPALAEIVFSDREKLNKLNEITHKHIKKDTQALLEMYEGEGARAVIIDAPVLFESGFDKMCDFTVCVTSPVERKIDRIMTRDQITREQAIARLNSQKTDSELIELATYQIDNSGKELTSQITSILKAENII
jgi:dephospho-CoA kinase